MDEDITDEEEAQSEVLNELESDVNVPAQDNNIIVIDEDADDTRKPEESDTIYIDDISNESLNMRPDIDIAHMGKNP